MSLATGAAVFSTRAVTFRERREYATLMLLFALAEIWLKIKESADGHKLFLAGTQTCRKPLGTCECCPVSVPTRTASPQPAFPYLFPMHLAANGMAALHPRLSPFARSFGHEIMLG